MMKPLFLPSNKLRNRIYTSMLALLLGAFFFIGVFTYYNFKTQNKNYHKNRLLRKEASTLSSINYYLKKVEYLERKDKKISSLFQNKVFELADIHNLDIIIYNLDGELIISADKKNSREEIISEKIEEEILIRLKKEKQRISKSFNFEGLDYLNSYQYIKDDENTPIAIISIPYSELNENYKRDLRSYLIALIPIYLILFLIASVLALFLSRQITDPMRQLSEVMRKAALLKKYMPLKWVSHDEIGQLVKQYNFMVMELEKSAEILALNEKESAWKEMAKQVAHEIKNPLTPMKLSVQVLEKNLDPKDPNFKKILSTFSASMVEQINSLANIANAFSLFAQMPPGNKEPLNIVKIIEKTLVLFESINIIFNKPSEPCIVLADKNQFRRVLNNLINNAIEASQENEPPKIIINLTKTVNNLLLVVEDSGIGIPKKIKNKIFKPNFSTKNSNMGLGLAIVKKIIVDLGGTISFEDKKEDGASFHITIPLLKEKN